MDDGKSTFKYFYGKGSKISKRHNAISKETDIHEVENKEHMNNSI